MREGPELRWRILGAIGACALGQSVKVSVPVRKVVPDPRQDGLALLRRHLDQAQKVIGQLPLLVAWKG